LEHFAEPSAQVRYDNICIGWDLRFIHSLLAALACEDGTVRVFRVENPSDVHLEGTLQSNDQCRLVSVHWDQADTVWAGSDGCVYGWNINQNASAPKMVRVIFILYCSRLIF
jgi:WD40 repeat protein